MTEASHGGIARAAEDGSLRAPVVDEAELLRRMMLAATLAERGGAWLALQVAQVPRAEAAALWEVVAGVRRLVTVWPETPGPGAVDEMEAMAALSLGEKRPVARGRTDLPGVPVVAVPVLPSAEDAKPFSTNPVEARPGTPQAALIAAMALAPALGEDREQGRAAAMGAIRRLQWGSGWLRDELRRKAEALRGGEDARARRTLELLAGVLDRDSFPEAAMAAVTGLALRGDCERVAVGFPRRGNVRVAAISHSAQFGRQMNLVRATGEAMDEAIDQRTTVLFPAPDDRPVATTAQAALSRISDGGSVLTIPVHGFDRFLCAFTFQRARDEGFDAETIALLDVVASTLGPILEEKRLNHRWIGAKIGEAVMVWLRRLLGPGYPLRKLVAGVLLLLVVVFSVARGDYRVSADAELQGRERRSVTAAYDGFVMATEARSGDVVKAGQLLARLDDQEFVLERLRRETERAQYARQYDDALAARQPALANVIRNQIGQAEAQIRLIDEQIARTRLTAPFDGIVISGDLTQRIGDAVSRGDVLFEMVPMTGYRVSMEVDERQVADIISGQAGEIVFSALPRDAFAIAVDMVTPIAHSRDGRNLFRVEADLTADAAADPRLRPGMTGVAKVQVGRERLITIWTRPLTDWLRMQRWRWLG